MTDQNQQQADCEYIVVGSGAGGGTVAARLAEAGRKVVLLEAGPRDWHPMIHVPAGVLKQVGTDARKEIEHLLERHVFLQLNVKVREDWRMNPRMLHELEYSD